MLGMIDYLTRFFQNNYIQSMFNTSFRFAVHNSPYRPATQINGLLNLNRDDFQRSIFAQHPNAVIEQVVTS